MNIAQAKQLGHGDIIYHSRGRNADGTPVRYRVNGSVRTWKRDPNRIEIPLKYGLYVFYTLTGPELWEWYLNEEDAIQYGRVCHAVHAYRSRLPSKLWAAVQADPRVCPIARDVLIEMGVWDFELDEPND